MDWFFGRDAQGNREFHVPQVANQAVAKHHRRLMVTVVGIITTLAIASTNSALWMKPERIVVGGNSFQARENFACYYTPEFSCNFAGDQKTVCTEKEMEPACEKFILPASYTQKRRIERGCFEKECTVESDRESMVEMDPEDSFAETVKSGVDPKDISAQTMKKSHIFCEKIMAKRNCEGNCSGVNLKKSNLQIWAEALPEATCVWCLFVWCLTFPVLYICRPWIQRFVYYILLISETLAVLSLLVHPFLTYMIPQFIESFFIICVLVTALAFALLYIDHCFRFRHARRQEQEI